MYLTAQKDGQYHIWRQRFPDGAPEQLTFGPTSQEGIALAPDGKSLITAVGSQDSTVWFHDKDGDHQISSEGYALKPSFSSDGKSLYYLMASGQTPGYELQVKDLTVGNTESLLPGYFMTGLLGFQGWEGSRVRGERQERTFQPLGRANESSHFPDAHLALQRRSTIPPFSCRMAISFFAPSKATRIFSIA